MPAVTYLSEAEVAAGRTVPDDKDCNQLLQELRTATGRDWIVRVHKQRERRFFASWFEPNTWKLYTLYNDCHGEWQVMNLVTPSGGSNFHAWRNSREAVMNFMLGYIAGLPRPAPTPAEDAGQ